MNATNTPDAVSVPREILEETMKELASYRETAECDFDDVLELESELRALLAAPPSEPEPEPEPEFVERDPGFMPWQIEGVSGWFNSSEEALAAWRKTSEPVTGHYRKSRTEWVDKVMNLPDPGYLGNFEDFADEPAAPAPEPVKTEGEVASMTFEEALNLLPDYMLHHSECNAASRFKARKDGEPLECDCGADRVLKALNATAAKDRRMGELKAMVREVIPVIETTCGIANRQFGEFRFVEWVNRAKELLSGKTSQ